ncbi:hypothetical protein N7461_006601 [Penicillium sp. DV-2018c]|nr:hypothetical protein N7461_006601 [Penicillium sp. DV-2018c]
MHLTVANLLPSSPISHSPSVRNALVSVKDVLEVALEIVVLLGMIKNLARIIFNAIRDLLRMIWRNRQQQWEENTRRFGGQ